MRQDDGSKRLHTLWSVKYCAKAGTNLFSLTCELMQQFKINSDQKNYIVLNIVDCNIVLGYQIKTRDEWMTRA